MQITVWQYYKKFWHQYVLGIAALLITNALSASIPYQIKIILDAINNKNVATHWQELSPLAYQVLGTLILMFFVRVTSRYFLIGVGRLVEYDLRQKLFKHLTLLSQSFFDANPTGQLMSRLANDLSTFRIFMGGAMMLLFNALFAFTMVPFLMWQLNWQLTLFSLLIFPGVLLIALKQSKKLKKLTMQAQAKLGSISSLAEEDFSGAEVIKAYTQEDNRINQFETASKEYRHINMQVVKLRVFVSLIVAIIGSLSMALVLGKGGAEVINHTLQLSSLAAFLLYLERLAWPTITIGWILSSFQQGTASIDRINQIFKSQPDITDAQADQAITQLPSTQIKVQNLSFRYPEVIGLHQEKLENSEREEALSNINLELPANQLIAIVGPVGSGKTTLLNLLARRYPIENNKIFYGEIPIEQIPIDVLRKTVTLMTQHDFLFSLSLKENLLLSQNEALLPNIVEITTLKHDIEQLENGIDTIVGERGVLLSGGQRQRAALSRTLLVDADVLLLDDPFSNVDYDTEQKIMSGLLQREKLKDKTTIVVSHRFSLVTQANLIVVLNAQGELDTTGTHEELLKTSALYQELYHNDHSANHLLEAS